MKSISLANELAGNSYPGRGIVIGKSADGKYAVTAYFIMGRRRGNPYPGFRSFQTGRSQSDHLRTRTCPW